MKDDVVFFKFCPGVPWRIEGECVKPVVSREIWNKIVCKSPVSIIFPGLFLESLLLPQFNKVLKTNGINVSRWIAPSYYTPLLSLFGIKNETTDVSSTVFTEFDRLYKATTNYPCPFFMDRENNIYFNVLFNYGVKLNTKGKFVDRDYEHYWRQILRNTCCYPYETSYPYFDKQALKDRITKFFKSFGADFSRPYIVVDNTFHSYKTADDRVVISRVLLPHHIRTIGSTVLYKKMQVIVLSQDRSIHYGISNIFSLPPWYKINSADLFSILYFANSVYSSDPNIYMSAGFLGCPRIFGASNFDDGFRLVDNVDITMQNGSRKWVEEDTFDFSSVIGALLWNN